MILTEGGEQDAIEEGLLAEDVQQECQDGDEGWEATETSCCDCLFGPAKSESCCDEEEKVVDLN